MADRFVVLDEIPDLAEDWWNQSSSWRSSPNGPTGASVPKPSDNVYFMMNDLPKRRKWLRASKDRLKLVSKYIKSITELVKLRYK